MRKQEHSPAQDHDHTPCADAQERSPEAQRRMEYVRARNAEWTAANPFRDWCRAKVEQLRHEADRLEALLADFEAARAAGPASPHGDSGPNPDFPLPKEGG